MLAEIGEGQRPVEDGGVDFFGVEVVEKSFEVLVTDLDETRPVPGVAAEGVDCSFEDLWLLYVWARGVSIASVESQSNSDCGTGSYNSHGFVQAYNGTGCNESAKRTLNSAAQRPPTGDSR